jgi:hypothetical protein
MQQIPQLIALIAGGEAATGRHKLRTRPAVLHAVYQWLD